jgi:tetratricopeptide (TPR) repeat protein
MNSSETIKHTQRLQSFLSQDPDNLNLLADLADAALDEGKFALAHETVERALLVEPGNPFFRLRLSSIAMAEGHFDEAVQITSALISERHIDAAVRFNHAYALLSQQDYASAVEFLEPLFAEDAPYPNVGLLLMRGQHYLGNVERAIEVGLAYMEKHPEDSICAGMLGLLYFDLDDLPQADVWAKRSLASGKDNIDALLAASGTALGAEDPDAAKQLLHRAIDLQPRNGRAWTSLGLVDMLDANLSGAEQKLTQAVQYMPGHLGSWVALGWAQLMQGKLDAAEASFRQALDQDDTFAEIHSGLAAVAAMRGDMGQAEEYSKTARRLDPSAISSQYPQLVKLYREGRADDATRLIQAALQRGKAPAGGTLLDMSRRMAAKRKRHS